MQVHFQIIKNDKVIENWLCGYACFSTTRKFRGDKNNKISVDYTYYNCPFKSEQVMFFHEECNRWGFKAEHTLKEGRHTFSVTKRPNNYLSLLAPLVSRRYMEENTSLIKVWFQLVKEFPDIETFYLFQLCHYLGGTEYYNPNHTFLSNQIYFNSGKLRKLVPTEALKSLLKEDSPYGNEEYDTIGLDQLIKNKTESSTKISFEKVSEFYKDGKLLDLIKLLT